MAEERKSPITMTIKYRGKKKVVLEYLVWMDPSWIDWLVNKSGSQLHFLVSRARWLLEELEKLRPLTVCPICRQRTVATEVFEVTEDHYGHKNSFPLQSLCSHSDCYQQFRIQLETGTEVVSYPAKFSTAFVFKTKAAQERWARKFLKMCGYTGNFSPQGILDFLQSVEFPV